MDTREARTERRARTMRKQPTYVEAHLWKLLRNRRFDGMKFRRQVRIGPYIADFVSYSSKLLVEADGGVHRLREEADRERDIWLTSQGFTVLRFPNEVVLSSPSVVFAAITTASRQASR
jgi:very-short-patch-repair endonuclease